MSRYVNKFAQARKAAKARGDDDRPLVDRMLEARLADLSADDDDKPARTRRAATRARRGVAK